MGDIPQRGNSPDGQAKDATRVAEQHVHHTLSQALDGLNVQHQKEIEALKSEHAAALTATRRSGGADAVGSPAQSAAVRTWAHPKMAATLRWQPP